MLTFSNNEFNAPHLDRKRLKKSDPPILKEERLKKLMLFWRIDLLLEQKSYFLPILLTQSAQFTTVDAILPEFAF